MLLPLAGAAIAVTACNIYGGNLVGSGGAGGSGASGSPTSSGNSTSMPMPCTDVSQCTLMATECQKPVCKSGFCGVEYTAMGTAITAQAKGDCQKIVCDGQGNTTSVADDMDAPDDMNDCTTDACSGGMPKHTPEPKGTQCTGPNNGKLCTDAAKCVECLSASDCTSMVCNAGNACVAAGCGDGKKNGNETDIDCGGGSCPGCGPTRACAKDSDCLGMMCVNSACAATCTDGFADGDETDVDCGGSCPNKCATTRKCSADADCQSGKCTSGACADVLLISQVQTRGDLGGNDEFVEIYNPTSIPVTFDVTWALKARSAISVTLSTCATTSLATRFTGAGQVIPPHGHILHVNTSVPAYDGPTPGNGTYNTGVPDAASVVLQHGNVVVDALCFYYDATTQGVLTGCSAPYICEGMPIMNTHNNAASSNADASLERKPGGAMGNTVDTNDNSADFAANAAADPHNLASMPVP